MSCFPAAVSNIRSTTAEDLNRPGQPSPPDCPGHPFALARRAFEQLRAYIKAAEEILAGLCAPRIHVEMTARILRRHFDGEEK